MTLIQGKDLEWKLYISLAKRYGKFVQQLKTIIYAAGLGIEAEPVSFFTWL